MTSASPLRCAAIALLVLTLGAGVRVASSVPRFTPLTAAMRAAMTGGSPGIAWKPGCPVPLDDLAAVQVPYRGFDGRSHQGTLVIHKRFANDIGQIFQELYAINFPINRVGLWSTYGSDVYAEKNITVGFYCEKADDAPTEWSGHAYGIAVDLNPLDNPYRDVKKGWWPKISIPLAIRDGARGKVSPQSEAFRIFARHGWSWGGFDVGDPDYMHFSKVMTGGGANPLERPYVVNSLQYVPGGALEAAQPK